MATFTNNFYGGGKGYNLCLDVITNSQNVANNTSNVTVNIRLVSLGSSYTIKATSTRNGSVTINGTKYSFTFTSALTGNENKTLYTTTVDIPHNADGTKTLSVSASCDLGVTLTNVYYGNTTVSGSTTLTTIPRSTPVTISGSGTFGSSKWIGHYRTSTAFTVTLRYVCGSSSGTIVSKSATNETYWTPPKSLQSEIPKSTSTTITIYCDTYNGSTLIGTSSTSFTCNIASDCVPTISGGVFSCVETGEQTYYQTVNRMRAEIYCSGAYGSTITKYVMTVDGQSITNYGNIIWTGYLTGSGYKDIVLTITDSRGKTATKTWSGAIYVTEYFKPKIYSFTCKRMGYDDDGSYVISNLGTHGYISYDALFHSNGTNKTIKMQYKPTSSTSWTTVSLSAQNMTDYRFSTSLSTSSAYDLKLILTDNVSTVEHSIVMQNIFPLINLSADGTAVAFGKECNASNKFMVSMNASFNNHTDFWTANVASTLTANSLSTTYDVTAGNNLIATNNVTVPKMIYSPPLNANTGNGQVINTGSDGQTLYVGNPKIKLQLESVQNIQANLNGTVYEVITSRKYKQATWLWSGTFNSTASYITLPGGASYSAIILYSTIGSEDSMVSQIVPWNIYNAGSLWIRVNGAAAGQFVKYRLTTSGSDVIVYWAGSSASGSKLQYIYGIC